MAEKPGFEQIEQRTAPNGARANLTYRPQTAQNWLNLGRAIGQASDILGRQQERMERLKMQNFEEQINTQYKEMNNALAQSQDPAQFDAIVGGALEKMKATGKDYLGDRLFNQWERDFGANYYAALKADTDGQKIRLNQKLAFNTAQDTVKQKAYAYGYAPESEHAALDRDFALYLENNEFPPLQKQALKEQYGKEKVNSRLSYLLDADPAKIAYTDKTGKVVSPMDDEKQYTELTVAEKVRWKNAALKTQAASIGTIKEKPVDEFLTNFNRLRQENPTAAGLLYDQFVNRPADMQAKYGLTAQQAGTARTYMKSSLEDGNLGAEKQNNFAEVNVRYNLLGLDENGIFHEKKGGAEFEQPKLEEMTQLMTDIEAYMGSDGFASSDKNKAVDLMNGLRYALGRQVKENTVELAEKADGWFTQGVSEYVQSKVMELLKRSYGNKNIPENAVADLYFATYGELQKRRMNLKSQSNEDKTVAREVLRQTWNTLIANKYATDPEKVGAVLGKEGELLGDSGAVDPEAFKLTAPKGYKPEEVNGRMMMVRRDENGNIIDQIAANSAALLGIRGF